MLRMFISHAHEDKALAAALQQLILEVFPPGETQPVRVDYSSDEAPAHGPAAGAEWLEWILEAVRLADVCVVMLSENSVNAPWLTWEAGAVTGAALSTVPAASPADGPAPGGRVIPLLFGVTADRIPAPLQHRRAVNGTEPTEVAKLLYRLHGLSRSSERFDDARARASAEGFVEVVRHAVHATVLERSPRLSLPDKAAVHFINCQSSLVMEPIDGSISNGIRISCGKLTGDAHQQWRLLPVRKGAYRITTADHSKCLSVQHDSPKPGAPIMLWNYDGDDSQHWRIESDRGGANTLSTVRIFNGASNLCLMPTPGRGLLTLVEWENLLDQDWWVLLAPIADFQ